MYALPRSLLGKCGLWFGTWTAIGLLVSLQGLLLIDASNRAGEQLGAPKVPMALGELLGTGLIQGYLWGFFAIPVLRLGRRFPFGRATWRRNLLVHFAACLVLIALEVAASVAINHLLRQQFISPLRSSEVLWLYAIAKAPQDVLLYWVLLCIGQAVLFHRKYQERELRTSQLETQLAQAQLQVLKMQLHPHFLFNTLHAISALLHEDVELADRMIARLGDLLRATLEQAGVQEVTLREELDFIRPYLEIERARMGARLTVSFAVAPETLDALVPNLLLQPLVENAIRHGIAPRAEPGHIEIRARREGQRLRLEVTDDGPGLVPGKFHEGVGVANTRARLRHLYGRAHAFEMNNGPEQGVQVAVTIPFSEQTHNGNGYAGAGDDDPRAAGGR